MALNIIKQTSNFNTTASKNRPILYIEIHYTAGGSSKKGTARSTAKYWANPLVGASCDFVCDDVEVVQYNSDIKNRYCWAVGGGKGNPTNKVAGTKNKIATNKNSIGIEICSNKVDKSRIKYASDRDWYFTKEALNNAIELTRYLMATYNIPIQNVITHNHVTSKLCPSMWSWDNEAVANGYENFIAHLLENRPYEKTIIPTWKYVDPKKKTTTTPPTTSTKGLGIQKHPQFGTVDFNTLDYSLIFDWQFYKNKYPDLAKNGLSTLQQYTDHFKTKGMLEGRQGCATFNPVAYKNYNPDVAVLVGTDVKWFYAHYCLVGKSKGRRAI